MAMLYMTPSGRAMTVVSCRKTIYLLGRRIPAERWQQRLPIIDGWSVTVYAESETSLAIHAALAAMWGSNATGGLRHNLKRARAASVLYEVQWPALGLKVALCDQDPALEGGLGNLIKIEKLFRQGQISMPPSIAAIREIWASCPEVDAIMLPASPMESNGMRVAHARVLLVRPEVLARLDDRPARILSSPHRVLLRLITQRASDRMASLEDPPGHKLWTAPRLLHFLASRRIDQAKGWLRRVFIENPKTSCVSVRDFLADRPKGSTIELVHAIGDLISSLLEGWAAVLMALALLITALSGAGLL